MTSLCSEKIKYHNNAFLGRLPWYGYVNKAIPPTLIHDGNLLILQNEFFRNGARVYLDPCICCADFEM